MLVVEELVKSGIEEIRVRSVLTCESKVGTLRHATAVRWRAASLVDVGEAVGIVAAQFDR